jgi:uncharacterized protein (TIGR03435 family)
MLWTAGAAAQSRFEAAVIKPSAWQPSTTGRGERGGGGGCPTTIKLDPARLDIKCATMAMLIGYAFSHPPDRVKGPDWMMSVASPRWDIAATIPAGASKGQVPEMMQSLLADRFGLLLHRGGMAGPIYALIVAKGGARLQPAADPAATEAEDVEAGSFYGSVRDHSDNNLSVISSPRMGSVKQIDSADHLHPRWEADSMSSEGLAELLDKVMPISVPIVDATELKGRYRLTLEVNLAEAGPPSELEGNTVRAFNGALRKFGLELERRRGEVATLLIDRVERTPAAN